jgi:hypothetical protein
LLDAFKTQNYEVNERQFAEYEINDPFAQAFVLELKDIYGEFESKLTEANFDALVHNSLRTITSQLERALLQKRFTQVRARETRSACLQVRSASLIGNANVCSLVGCSSTRTCDASSRTTPVLPNEPFAVSLLGYCKSLRY